MKPVSIVILIEGPTEHVFMSVLREFVVARTAGPKPKIVSNRFGPGGRIPKRDALKQRVRLLLAKHDHVVALTDVYTGSSPRDFEDASDAKRKMREWVGSEEKRFHPHAAQYEFEAWLLPFWDEMKKFAKSDRGSPGGNPEKVNHDRPPSKRINEMFVCGKRGKGYDKTGDASRFLTKDTLPAAADACPELKAFLNTILRLSGGARLE